MTGTYEVAVLVGSLRRDSYSRRLALDLLQRARGELDCRLVEIGNLALYNEDLDTAPPPAWVQFRAEVASADAVLFVTPEYNRSIPGALKNAIDVGSRPYGQSVFNGKPAAVVSLTPYKLGAFGANHALRQTFVFLNMPALQQPEVYLGGAAELFDTEGRVKPGEVAELLDRFVHAFAEWIARCSAPRAQPAHSSAAAPPPARASDGGRVPF
ncbi:MAG: NAD(P)H-dependent oxidoreductase [Gammaproteobacteria bacterium]|nr:NAD(P)H-dependent oxidoreductase [Gammaproteobacteria bacterium]MBV9697755.1 NAD(P)H-dependent oxidoreductase [Gammaproteobacteria bacterium]